MAQPATIAATVRGSAQSAAYLDEPECSPPPYPYREGRLPPQFFYHVNPPADDPAEDPPEYNYYDVERGSLIDLALAQYAQSISPRVQSTQYSLLEQDEDASFPRSDLSGRFRSFLFYCMAMFCGAMWAVFWICAIGYAIVISFQKVAESLT
jgi:hypothetical protein